MNTVYINIIFLAHLQRRIHIYSHISLPKEALKCVHVCVFHFKCAFVLYLVPNVSAISCFVLLFLLFFTVLDLIGAEGLQYVSFFFLFCAEMFVFLLFPPLCLYS